MEDVLTILQNLKRDSGITVYPFLKGEPLSLAPDFLYGIKNGKFFAEGCTTFSFNDYTFAIKGDGEAEKVTVKLLQSFLKDYFTEDVLSGILNGKVGDNVIEDYRRKNNLPLTEAFVMIINVKDGAYNDVAEFFKNASGNGSDIIKVQNDKILYVKFFDKVSREAFRSPKEYAEILRASLIEETGVYADFFLGREVDSFIFISLSYKEAVKTEQTAKALNLKGVYEFKEFISLDLINSLDDRTKKFYYDLLITDKIKRVLSDPELFNTAKIFIDCNLNGSLAARKLFIHRNTLKYRLEKIFEETGLNIKNFDDAVTFKTAALLFQLL